MGVAKGGGGGTAVASFLLSFSRALLYSFIYLHSTLQRHNTKKSKQIFSEK